MKIILVIPARYASTRFPGKPLIDINGKSMIHRVYDQCKQAIDPSLIYVATDDERIENHCNKLGIQTILTSSNCKTGTDRVAEVAEKIAADYYINVQGDEPVFNPNDIRSILEFLPKANGGIVNGYCPISSSEEFYSLSTPKVVFRSDERLLYMSRSPIPGNKQSEFRFGYRQVCIYGFPRNTLEMLAKNNDKTPFEEQEDIEILRFLELGYDVQMVKLSNESIPVDNPEDLEKVLEKLNNEK
jgi:3-deoxy-manno-octulosonate cytidylyltransferase (CMP-KDO synthetase)